MPTSSELDEWQQLNNMVGEQLSALIEKMHGKELPFILIMPPTDEDIEAQLVTNIDDIPAIQRTLRYLDKSLSKVKKLQSAKIAIQ